jgi:hypothetical protein
VSFDNVFEWVQFSVGILSQVLNDCRRSWDHLSVVDSRTSTAGESLIVK